MLYTVADTLGQVEGAVPLSLVDPGAWRTIRALAGRIPAPLPQAFYFECRLGAGAAPVDWIVRVEEAGREILARRNPHIHFPDPPASTRVWERIARFCAAWADEPGLREAVAHLWLEFDLPCGSSVADPPVPDPSVFVATDPRVVESFTTLEWVSLLDRLLALLGPEPTFPPMRRALRYALVHRLAQTRIPYVGFMLARAVQHVRLYLSVVPADTLPSSLRGLGWGGNAGELADALACVTGPTPGLAPPIGMVHVDVDGDGEVLPHVGMEFTLARPEQRHGRILEVEFLDHLVDLGLCTPARRRGLTEWSGCSGTALRHELWPTLMSRRLNCIKLVHDPGRVPEAKGYLLAEWRPLARRGGNATHRGMRASLSRA